MGQGVLQYPETQAGRKVVKSLSNVIFFDCCCLFFSFWDKREKIVTISLFCVWGVENVYYICMCKLHLHHKHRCLHTRHNIELKTKKDGTECE